MAIKYFKSKATQDFLRELVTLRKMGELYGEFGKNKDIWIIKYCGDSLETLLDHYLMHGPPASVELAEKDIKKFFKSGLEAIYRFHKKSDSIHSDVKPDNICVKDDETFELMDYGLATPISSQNQINDASKYLLAKYKDKYKGKSFYDLLEEEVPLEYFQPPVYGNFVWSFRSSFEPRQTYMTTGDDIEGLLLSLWNYYDPKYKLANIYKSCKNQAQRKAKKLDILRFRLDPDNCPFPTLRNALVELRKNYSITVPELCTKLKLDCKLSEKSMPKTRIHKKSQPSKKYNIKNIIENIENYFLPSDEDISLEDITNIIRDNDISKKDLNNILNELCSYYPREDESVTLDGIDQVTRLLIEKGADVTADTIKHCSNKYTLNVLLENFGNYTQKNIEELLKFYVDKARLTDEDKQHLGEGDYNYQNSMYDCLVLLSDWAKDNNISIKRKLQDDIDNVISEEI